MKNILLIGAGRSATALIHYLLVNAAKYDWNVTVADSDTALAQQKVGKHSHGRAVWLDVSKQNDRRELISRHDVVISLLPVFLHMDVAQDCIKLRKHLVTASYVTKEMYGLSDEVKNLNLIFMGEMGLDPGIDHMSAVQKINEIKAKGGKIVAFRSYTGGLVAPESDDNPWNYKISWNPRNVVLAGQGTAQYLEADKHKYIPYNRLFTSHEVVQIQNFGELEMYPNRDSLLYREAYGIENTPNIIRGTLRHKGFCEAWNAVRKIGLTDNSYPIVDSDSMTYHELMEAYVWKKSGGTVRDRIANLVGTTADSEIMKKLEWLGLFSKKKITLTKASPALILEQLMVEKMTLGEDDKDMVIMQHEFEYKLNRRLHKLTSTMILKGEDAQNTAMAKTVGLPVGIFVKLLMEGKMDIKGVNIPTVQQIYDPVLKELEAYGVYFLEKDEIIQ
ncbi:MAG: saccharopine dehydrogenase C-terminal domain-containing protein [Saprospiraceae bacterium]